MKKFLFFINVILAVIIFNGEVFSANELFRSVASGSWNAIGTWQMSTNNGGTWIAATGAPTDTSGTITIQSPNTVTVTVSTSADQLIVNGGGTITINAAIILTLKDGSGDDLTLYSTGIISGSGTFQTQGASITMNVKNGSTFSVLFKLNTGKAICYDTDSPNIAKFYGPITVDAGSTLSVQSGGYYLQSFGNITNNGIITTESLSGSVIMSGASLINNDTIRGGNLNFDDTTSLSGTGAYRSTNITVTGTGNVLLAGNVTFSPISYLIINGNGILNPNTRTLTFNSGTLIIYSGGTTVNSGIFQTQGSVSLIVKSGCNFNSPLKINTGTCTGYDDGSPNIANYKGSLTVDAGATLTTPGGGYTNKALGDVTNNGSISGNQFSIRGANLNNSGVINPLNFSFDSTTNVSGTGTYSGANININATGNVTLINNVTFSPTTSFTINSGGIFYPGSKTFTFNSGSFILNTGATVSGVGPNAGTLQTQGSVTFLFRNGSTFNSAVKVNTGTLTAYNDNSPNTAIYYGIITVDAGATLNVLSGGYTAQANNSVINNGTITGTSGASFRMRGNTFTNNGSITVPNFYFDSTTSVGGTGAITSQTITITGSGNVLLLNNITFSPAVNMTINNGGILNPNTRIFTLNSGALYHNSGGTVFNSGTFQTQGTVSLIVRSGSNFNAPLKVNSGNTTSYDDGSPNIAIFKGTITVDAGATMGTPNGGYSIQGNNTVTVNGTINTPSGAFFRMRGASLVNNGIITGYYLNFDSTTVLTGTGTYTSLYISVNSSGNVSLGNNTGFTPGAFLEIKPGAVLSPSGFIFTLGSGTLYNYSTGTVSNSGTFRTQNSVNLIIRNGSNFNAPLNINTGTAVVFDDGAPFVGALNGTVTVDAGAVLTSNNGGYTIRCNGDVINNGTISASASPAFRMYGTNFTNNGTISFPNLYFESGAHNLQGTGTWTTDAVIQNGSVVTLTSNHQIQSVSILSGGTLNVSTFKLSCKGSNPISNSGTFNTSAGTVEYNGISLQTISTTGITYNKLRINNSAGTSLAGPVTVNDTLSVISGDLYVGSTVLTIAPTGYLSETPGNTVTGAGGYITTTRSLNAPSSLNVGGLGAVLTTAVNLGSTEIKRGFSAQSGLGGNTSIFRFFDITPTTNTGLNATLVFKYDETELNGKVESGLSLYKSTNTGSTWTSAGGTVNTSLNQITVTGLPSFSRWSASSASPVAAQIKLLIEGFYNTGTGRMNKKDTVRAYLRNTTTPFAIVDSAKSTVDSVTFTGNFLFAKAGTGTYYIQLKHRNSIETWSKTGGQLYTLASVMTYDFTTAAAQAFGSNQILRGTKYCIYGGDISQDGTVDASDVSETDNAAYNSLSGYVVTDVTGDNFVDAEDVSLVDNNSYNSVSVVRP